MEGFSYLEQVCKTMGEDREQVGITCPSSIDVGFSLDRSLVTSW